MKLKRMLLIVLVLSLTLCAVSVTVCAVDTIYRTPDAAAAALREAWVNRENEVTLTCQFSDSVFDGTSSSLEKVGKSIMDSAMKHTGVGHEGDYLQFNTGSVSYSGDWNTSDGKTTLTLTYSISYYTTAAQEAEVTQAISNALDNLNLDGMSDYQKIQTIYQYVVDTVEYDYDNVSDDSYLLKHTTYAAIIHRKAVCQGFATLLYRMLLEADIDNRVVFGVGSDEYSTRGSENHLWNIIKLGDVYYYADATWDDGFTGGYMYFLKGGSTFPGHEPDATCAAWLKEYPIASTHYVEPILMEGDFEYKIAGEYAILTRYHGTAKDVTIPSKLGGYPVRSIAGGAFDCTFTIEKVTIPACVEEIGNAAVDENEFHYGVFSQCKNLKEVVIPQDSKLRFIGESAFNSCVSLEKISLPSSIQELEKLAFSFCFSLKELTLPEGLQKVGQGALSTTGIEEIHIPASCTYFHEWNNPVTLRAITVASGNSRYRAHQGVLYGDDPELGWTLLIYPQNKPATTYRVPDYADCIFSDSSSPRNLRILYIGDCNCISYLNHGTEMRFRCEVIPDETNPYFKAENGMVFSPDGKELMQIPAHLTGTVTIPSGVERIHDYAGEDCKFTKLILPETVKEIGGAAFWYCPNLSEVQLPTSLISIGSNAFEYCQKLTDIFIPEGVTSIGSSAFFESGLKIVVLPSSIANIGHEAFDAIFGSHYVFYYGSKTQWQDVQIESGNEFFTKGCKMFYGENCFDNNFILKNGFLLSADGKTLERVIRLDENDSLIIPKGVTKIASNACDFLGGSTVCTNLYFPEDVTTIGDEAFRNLQHCKSIYLPKSITTVGKYAFGGCHDQIVIEGGITRLEEWAFEGEELYIPQSVTYIGYNGTGGAKHIYYEGTKAQWEKIVIEEDDSNYELLHPTDDGTKIHYSVPSVVAIRKGPINQAATVNEKISVKVEAVGTDLKYQWYVKNPGSTTFSKSSNTTATYSCKMTEATDGRKVYCIVTDKYGHTAQSRTAILSLGWSITIPDFVYGEDNETISVPIQTTKSGLTYQWYVSAPGGSTFSESAITSDTYTCKLTESISGRRVYCVVTDQNGNQSTTNTATLCLGTPLIYLGTQPSNASTFFGEESRLPLYASGTDLTYTWYYNSNDTTPDWKENFKKSSVTGPVYTCKLSEEEKERHLKCVIADRFGNQIELKGLSAYTVKITKKPKSQCVSIGETASVSVKYNTTELIYCHWYIKNPGSDRFIRANMDSSKTYSVEMTQQTSGQEVYCVLTDMSGNRVKTDTVVLCAPVAITQQPSNTYVKSGKTAKISVEASGGGLTYQWYIKNAGAKKYSKSSVTSATYSCKMNEKSKDRYVYCVVTDQFGNTAKSKTIVLREAVSIVTEPKTGYAQLDKSVKVTVKASGDGLKYQWYFKNAGSNKYSKSSVTSATYSTKMTDKVHGRRVYCVVTDKYGKTVQSKTVLLRMAATITTQPENVSMEEGKTAKVTVKAVGDELTYQWCIKNAGKTKFSKSSVTSATYSCKMSEKSDGRQVYCVVTDKYGKTVQSNVITLSMK